MICPICQKEFVPSKYTPTRQKYCSRECYKKAKNANAAKWYQEHREECKAKFRKYWLTHKEELNWYQKKYRWRKAVLES